MYGNRGGSGKDRGNVSGRRQWPALPSGSCATIFAADIGRARHLVGAGDGVLSANPWAGVYYRNHTPHASGFLVALKDND